MNAAAGRPAVPATVLAACALALALPVRAQSAADTAVLVLPGAHGDVAELAASVRQALAARHVSVLSTDDTRQRLAGPRGWGAPVAVDAVEARIRQAEKLTLDEKFGEAVTLMEGLLASLAADAEPTAEKSDLLNTVRVKLAAIHLGQAGRAETGQANTEAGRKAVEQFQRIVEVDPGFALDAARFPPRLRKLLDVARAESQRLPRASLTVKSHPEGATVFINGRPMGVTPLDIHDVAAGGPYRLWLEHQGRRSLVRNSKLTAETTQLMVDMPVEGALLPSQGGLGVDLLDAEEGLLRDAAWLLRVRTLVLISQRPQDVALMVFDVERRLLVRRGQVPITTPSLPAVLARFALLDADEAVLLTPSTVTVAPPRRVAVVTPSGPLWAPALTDAFMRALGELEIRDVVPADLLRGVQERCKTEMACLLAGVKSLNADALLVLDVTSEKPGVRWEAALLDATSGREVRRIRHRVSKAGPQEAGEVAFKLLAPSRFTGGVDVRAPKDGLRVWVDGVGLGVTPVAGGRQGLAVGRHLVRVAGPGLPVMESEVDVPMGAPIAVTVTLNAQTLGLRTGSVMAVETKGLAPAREAPPPRESAPGVTSPPQPHKRPLWPWGLVGVGSGGAALAAVMAAGGAVTGVVFLALFASYPRAPNGGVVLRQGETPDQAQNRVAGTAAAAAVGGGIMVLGVLAFLVAAGAAVAGVVAWLVL